MPDLATYEKRVAYAAHQYSDQYPVEAWERCERLGITSEEFCKGIELRTQQEMEYRSWTRQYGKQEYGGWARDPRDGRYKPQAVICTDEPEDERMADMQMELPA